MIPRSHVCEHLVSPRPRCCPKAGQPALHSLTFQSPARAILKPVSWYLRPLPNVTMPATMPGRSASIVDVPSVHPSEDGGMSGDGGTSDDGDGSTASSLRVRLPPRFHSAK